MTPPAHPPSVPIDEPLKHDLRATVRLNLMMPGVWLSDAEVAALVDALAARLDGEWRARRLRPPPAGRDGGPA